MGSVTLAAWLLFASVLPVEPATFESTGKAIYLEGYLSQYGRQPTDATIAYRQKMGQIPKNLSRYDGVVAVESCQYIGKQANLKIEDRWFRVIVFDCLGRDVETNWMQENRIIAEVGYHLVNRLRLVGQGGIEGRLVILE